jgi:MinD superfamily P-loop ATPase
MTPIDPLRVAVASGKGGTGKTTVATSLACLLGDEGRPVCYFDADVEAPNGHLFLQPHIASQQPVNLLVPELDTDLCTGCGECAELCQYGAIISVGPRAVILPDLCHGCGGCPLACPEKALSERPRRIGSVSEGQAGPVAFVSGQLDIGQALAPPVIRAGRARLPEGGVHIIDSPPGTACPAVQAVRDAHVIVLVTEPTPFGLHDLDLAVAMARPLERPLGIVVNRADDGVDEARRYCREQRLEILAEIPDDRRVAEACSRGEITLRALPEYEATYRELWRAVERLAA